MKKVLAIILAVVITMTSVVPVFAAVDENVIEPRYTYILRTDATLSINTNTGISTSIASLYCTSGYIAEVECELQQYIGSTWSTIKTWTNNRGSYYAAINEDWAVYSGYNYRVYVTYRVYNSSKRLLESTTAKYSCYYPPK